MSTVFDEELRTGMRWIPLSMGLPIELDAVPLRREPLATWTVAAAIAAVSLVALFRLDRAVAHLGLVPAQPWRWGGVTLLTSFFVHAGLLHLVSNLYFLVVLGDNLEDYLGRGRFLTLLLMAAVAGGVAHVLAVPGSQVPLVGASGGISGVILFYGLHLPRARMAIRIGKLLCLRLHVVSALCIWIAFQLFLLMVQLANGSDPFRFFGNIAATAHLGGAVVGLVAWVVWRKL